MGQRAGVTRPNRAISADGAMIRSLRALLMHAVRVNEVAGRPANMPADQIYELIVFKGMWSCVSPSPCCTLVLCVLTPCGAL